ncbi:MAG TPA: FtsW/RodA/SpoVE family cell cycle protein, partial [Chloroflexota bacterium]|nr:FtsW/RodA/SpoVE family cell cycle protein [Chloroflexota bacterium]
MVGKIVWQAALNIAVITNTVPYTGVPLPLISYGASSLVVTMISIGVLYSVLRFRAQIPERASAMPVSDDSNEAAGLLSAGARIRQYRARFKHA